MSTMTFITIGNRSSINEAIANSLMFGLGSTSKEAVDAFNVALHAVERQAGWDDYDWMCAVMKHARAELAETTS